MKIRLKYPEAASLSRASMAYLAEENTKKSRNADRNSNAVL